MKQKLKINAKNFVDVFPSLMKINKKNTRKRINKIVSKNDNKTMDSICECVSTGLGVLKPTDFPKKDFKKLTRSKEMLRFLSNYASCSRNKRKKLQNKRNEAALQGGQGLGILLTTLLPILADIVIKKFT